MNLTDLRDVLDQRSAEPVDRTAAHHLRLSAVRARIAARRRRRTAVGAACAAVVLLVTGTTIALNRATTDPSPGRPAPAATRGRLIEGFPEYAEGTRVTAAGSAALPTRTIDLTLVPGTPRLVLFGRCRVGGGVRLDVELQVNGHGVLSGGCDGALPSIGYDLSEAGVEPGRPVTVRMVVTGARTRTRPTVGPADDEQGVPTAVPADGDFALAVGEPVPFADYPLPSRPAALKPLGSAMPSPDAGSKASLGPVLRADPTDPNRRQRLTVTWRAVETVWMVAQTPGALHLRVDGTEVMTNKWWDYGQGRQSGPPDSTWPGRPVWPGKQVTIEVVPEHMTGDWAVVLELAAGP
jgi:hypothetical protein